MPIRSSRVGVRSQAWHELVAQLALGGDPLRPGHDEGIADAAAMGVLLVAAQRRVRRHRPAVREVAVRVRPADVVDPAQLFRDRLGTEIVRPHRVDEAERPALLAGAVVGQHEDQRVVADAGRVEERDQPRQMLVGMVEHAGEGRLQPREDAPFVGAVLVPRLHAVIARGQPGFRRHDPHRLLPRHPLLALDVPAMGEHRVIALDDVRRRLVRRVAGAERDPGQPRDIGPVGGVVGDEADRLVDQVGRQVIAVRIGARADRYGCCRRPAPARTGRSRHRGSRRSDRSRGRAASRRTARWRRFRSAA